MTVKAKPEPQDTKVDASQAESLAAAAITRSRRRTAWQIHRFPVERHATRRQLRVHLPRSYLAKDGIDVRVVNAGTDLNFFLYRHYECTADQHDTYKVNFVSSDNIQGKKWTNFLQLL